MLLGIGYVEGYGWHVGRLILWPLLVIVGAVATGVLALSSHLLGAFLHWPIPLLFAPPLVVPLVYAVLLRRRIRRKQTGEPFVVTPPGIVTDYDMETLLVSRGHAQFRALLMIEYAMWGSAILVQLGIVFGGLAATFGRR